MTRDEYKNLVDDIVKNPDTSATKAASLLDEIGKDLDLMDTMRQDISAKDKKIHDYNYQQFLLQTRPKDEAKEETDGRMHSPEDVDNFINSLIEKGSK